jgi:hypothetical protein
MRNLSLFILLTFAAALLAQVNSLTSRPNLKKEFDLDARFVPSTPTTVIDQDFWASGLVLSNNSTEAVQCSIADLQSSPVPLLPNTVDAAIPSGAVYSFTFDKAKMVGGVRWSCATGGVVAARLSGFIR